MKRFPSKNQLLKDIIKEAIKVQIKAVRNQYPEIADFTITYDASSKQFKYTGLTLEQIKTLPGITETNNS